MLSIDVDFLDAVFFFLSHSPLRLGDSSVHGLALFVLRESHLAPVQRLDTVIHWINCYPEWDKC